MSTIWKFPLPVKTYANFAVDMPIGSRLLTVQRQHDQPCLWALVDPDATLEKRSFRWFGTGHPVTTDLEFVGTVQLAGGTLVLHLFEDTLLLNRKGQA